MKVENISHSNINSRQSFGTKWGSNLQAKLDFAEARKCINPEQAANIAKISSDGLDVVLEVTRNCFAKVVDGKKIMHFINHLTVINKGKGTHVADLDELGMISVKNLREKIFMHKFVRIFNDNFNLAEKISNAAKE